MPELVVVGVMAVVVPLVHPEVGQLAAQLVVVGQLVVVVGQLGAQLVIVALHIVALHVVALQVVVDTFACAGHVAFACVDVVVLLYSALSEVEGTVALLVIVVVIVVVCAEMTDIPNSESATTVTNRAIVTFFITDLLLRCVGAFHIKARFSDYMLSLCIQQKKRQSGPEKGANYTVLSNMCG